MIKVKCPWGCGSIISIKEVTNDGKLFLKLAPNPSGKYRKPDETGICHYCSNGHFFTAIYK